MPRVSVFLPTYEPDPLHLREAVESVLAQTEADWEMLIHDDASACDVAAMVRPYLADPRIRFARSAARLGIGGNWNACRTQGSAPFIQYLFQDDLWAPHYLEHALKAVEDPRVGIAVTQHVYAFEGAIDPLRKAMYEDLEALRTKTMHAGRTEHDAFLRLWIERGIHPNLIGEPSFVLLRRPLSDAVGPFRQDMPQGLDVEYWLRCLARADLAWIPENGGAFRVHGKGASAVNEAQGHGLFDRVGNFGTLLRVLPRGGTRRLAEESMVEQFALMTAKFLRRKQAGGKTGGSGKGVLVRTALRHPLLVLRGMLRYARNCGVNV